MFEFFKKTKVEKVETKVEKTEANDFFNRTRTSWSIAEFADTSYVPSSKEMEDSYITNTIVRACIDIIAETLPTAELEVGKQIGDSWVSTKVPQIEMLLRSPNEQDTIYDFLKDVVIRLISGGHGYIWLRRNTSGKIVRMISVPSSYVSEVQDYSKLNSIVGYNVSFLSEPVPFEDMINISYTSPSDYVKSISPLASCWVEIQLDAMRKQYFSEFIKNFKIPSAYINSNKAGSKLGDDYLRKLTSDFGKGNAGNFTLLPLDETITVLNPLSELDMPGLISYCESRITSAIGVPALLVNLRLGLERSTFSNASQMSSNFYKNTMIRYWQMVAKALTKGLLNGTDLEFKFRYDKLDQFKETDETQKIITLFQNQLITVDEARQLMGLSKLEDNMLEEPIK